MESTTLMLDAIDKRIAKLQQIRAMIVEEFGQQSNGRATAKSAARKRSMEKLASKAASAVLAGRKAQIHSWLKENGPATRTEVIEGTKLPAGTISGYLSAEKDLFENRDGKWAAR